MAYFLIVLVVLTVIILVTRYVFTYWSRRGIDTVSPTFFFGNTTNIFLRKASFGLNVKNVYDELKKRGKMFGGYYFSFRPIFMPIDLNLMKQMMTADFNHFTDHIGPSEITDPLSNNLFHQKGDRWKRLRTLLTPTFTSRKIKMMCSTLKACAQNLTLLMEDKVKKKQIIDIKEISEKYTSDVIISCVFGIENGFDVIPELRKYQYKVLGSGFIKSMYVIFTFALPEFFSLFKIRTFDKDMANFFINIVKDTAKYREENNVIRKDLIHLLLQIKNNIKISNPKLDNVEIQNGALGSQINKKKDGKEFSISIEEIAAQCFVFFFAGYETSATTISFTLFELALHTEIQDRVRDEITFVLEKHNGEVTYDGILEMEYLHMCICETLRKYSPIQVNTRVCTKTYTIPNSNIVINKGMHVLIPILAIHHDPEFYPNPDKYDPERFSKENLQSRHPFAFSPFGGGPRMCIGYKFAFLQIKLALVSLLTKFRFLVHPDTKIPIELSASTIIPTATPPVKLTAEKIVPD